jgi:uncharacterized protein YggE
VKRTALAAPFVLAAVVAAFLLGGGHGPPQATAATPASSGADEGVVVEGVASATGTPDVLHLSLGVSGSGSDVTRALAVLDAQVARIRSELRAAGAKGTAIQTSGLSVYPQQTKKGRIFQVSEQLSATLPVKTAGAAISNALTVGGRAVTLQSISFALEQDDALLNKAREEAFADAKQKAERYARLSGRTLGKVQLVSETLRSPTTPSYGGSLGDSLLSAARKAVDVRLYAGTSEVSVSVSVRWALA